MNATDSPCRDDTVEVEELEQELLLYHPERGEAFNLNGTAAFIWSLCDGSRSLREIAGYIQEETPDCPEKEILDDVNETVENMKKNGLLQ